MTDKERDEFRDLYALSKEFTIAAYAAINSLPAFPDQAGFFNSADEEAIDVLAEEESFRKHQFTLDEFEELHLYIFAAESYARIAERAGLSQALKRCVPKQGKTYPFSQEAKEYAPAFTKLCMS